MHSLAGALPKTIQKCQEEKVRANTTEEGISNSFEKVFAGLPPKEPVVGKATMACVCVYACVCVCVMCSCILHAYLHEHVCVSSGFVHTVCIPTCVCVCVCVCSVTV